MKTSQIKSKHSLKNNNRLAIAFMAPSLVGVMIFAGIPFLEICRRSFLDARGVTFIGIKNYSIVLHNTAFQRACVNTMRFMGVCIPVILFLSFVLAYFIFSGISKRKQGFMKLGYLLPYALPVASFVIIWRLLFDKNGLVNAMISAVTRLLAIHYEGIDWMRTQNAFWILCMCYLWRQIGFYTVLWIAGMENIEMSVFEAARLEGVTKLQMAKDIIFPNVKSALHMIFVLALTGCFKCYREAYLVAGDYPDDSMYMLQHVFNNWFASLDTQKMSAGAVMLVTVIAVGVGLMIRKKEKAG